MASFYDDDDDDNMSNISGNSSVHSIDTVENDMSLGEQPFTATVPPMSNIEGIRQFLTELGVRIQGRDGSVTLLDIYNYAYLRGYGDGSMVNDSFASDVGPALTMEDLNTTVNTTVNTTNDVLNTAINNLEETNLSEGSTDLDMTLSFGNSFGGKKRRRKTKKSLKKRRKTRKKQ